jgi:uncharacterized membrane protein
MTVVTVLSLYLLAAFIPAYVLARNTRSIWRNLMAWLVGVLVEVGVGVATFIVAVSMNPEAAPLAIAMALVPALSILLITPCVGIAAAWGQRYINRTRPGTWVSIRARSPCQVGRSVEN